MTNHEELMANDLPEPKPHIVGSSPERPRWAMCFGCLAYVEPRPIVPQHPLGYPFADFEPGTDKIHDCAEMRKSRWRRYHK